MYVQLINPRRACAARVTVVVVCVCRLVANSLLKGQFVLKTLSHTLRATKVKKFVGFSLKPLRCRDPALPPLYGHAYIRPFFSCTRMRISRVYTRMIYTPPRVQHFSAFHDYTVLIRYKVFVFITESEHVSECVCH